MTLSSEKHPVVAKDPFRLFFLLGIALAIAGIMPWTLLSLGQMTYPGEFHRAVMINGFLLSFVSGFLMTAMPRFTSAPFATLGEIAFVFSGIFLSALFAWIGPYALGHGFAVLSLLGLLVFGIRRIRARKANPPYTFVFVFSGLVFWLLSNIFLLLSATPAFSTQINVGMWRDVFSNGAIMSMVLGIGGRLIPGILGWQEIVSLQRDRYEGTTSFLESIPLSFWGLLSLFVLSFVAMDLVPQWILLAIRFFVVAWFAFRFWNIQSFPQERTYFTWMIWLCCWCLVLGSLLVLLWRDHSIHALHFLLIAGFSLLTILVASRVTFAHGPDGKTPEKTKRSILVFAGFLVFAALLRVAAILWADLYIEILGLAAAVWLCGIAIWAWVVLPKMLAPLRKSSGS